MSIELNPCPFCAGTDLFIEPRDFGTAAVVICLECLASGPAFHSSDWLVPINDPDDRRKRTKRQAVKLAEGAAEKWQDRASQAGAAGAAGVPEGWQLVPVVPTETMVKAGGSARQNWRYETAAATYREMLAVAPTPAAEGEV